MISVVEACFHVLTMIRAAWPALSIYELMPQVSGRSIVCFAKSAGVQWISSGESKTAC
jgi:hypothetical protein